VDAARLTLGVVLVVRPDLPLTFGRVPGGRWTTVATRALGVRYVVQAGAGTVAGDPWAPPLDAAVDLVHAATMVVLAVASPAHRRLAVASAAAALLFAAGDLSDRTGGRS
jgi:hypothetical protein